MWSPEACLHYLQSYGAGNLFFSVPENLFDRAFLWHYWEAEAKLWMTAKNMFLVCSNYLKSGSCNVLRSSKQANAKLVPIQHFSLAQNYGVTPCSMGQDGNNAPIE
jgi:hypothetical protein